MPTITLQLPHMYGDHHVTAVRNLLLAMSGVDDVYASSSFQVVEITFDADLLDQGAIRAVLQAAGYQDELSFAVETGSGNGAKAIFRHTASVAQTGVVAFHQEVSTPGRPLWPCPGLDRPIQLDEEPPHGQED